MLPAAVLLHAALWSCAAMVTSTAPAATEPPPRLPLRVSLRRSPYSSFRSIHLPPGFQVEPLASRRTESFAEELPKLEDSPAGDFVGHPLDYGSSLNFGGPLATSVGKVKVLDYATRMNGEEGSATRYGKPLVKSYDSIYDSKSQGAKKYKSAAKKHKQLQRPTSHHDSSENEIEGSLVADGAKGRSSSRETTSSFEEQLAPFDLAPSRSDEESRESPFPEAGDMAGFFF